MKEEENVYEETTRSEDTTAVEEEKASTVPSKFKDVDALVRAYSSLQAEFTRRSQKLKELEKKLENFERGGRDARLGRKSSVEMQRLAEKRKSSLINSWRKRWESSCRNRIWTSPLKTKL